MKTAVFWFRHDLRLNDNKGLYMALKEFDNVLPLFIFDDNIIGSLEADDARIEFIHQILGEINSRLNKFQSSLLIQKGEPVEVLKKVVKEYNAIAVFCNADHEPYGINRDNKIKDLLDSLNVRFHSFIDHLVMARNSVLKPDGTPYRVFTPYMRQWKNILNSSLPEYHPSEDLVSRFFKFKDPPPLPSLEQLGFKTSGLIMPWYDFNEELIRNYHQTRDYPALEGTSRLGPQIRFGAISIRELVKKVKDLNETYLNELIWREFYAMIAWHFPGSLYNSFEPRYDFIRWRNDEDEFERWKLGLTGYALVDAGMRQLNAIGYMHNRVRMVTASFLSKHLLIDWRWGEAWFARKLFDYQLSSNSGGWQWSAGTGADAAPYFRIFNPIQQQKKFDPDFEYIKKWVPEYSTPDYPPPIVDHKMARERCLKTFSEVNRML
jgi:deoxyribodipyrimidine photo-lyase